MSQFVLRQIQVLRKRMNEIAHRVVQSPIDQQAYHQYVGKYAAYREQADTLEKALKADQQPPRNPAQPDDIDPADDYDRDSDADAGDRLREARRRHVPRAY